ANELPSAKEAAVDLSDRVRKLEEDARALDIASPVDGVVMNPPGKQPDRNQNALQPWEGVPLVEENIGAFLESKTLLCLVGDPDDHEAVIFVHQSEIEYLRKGQGVTLRLDIAGSGTLRGEVVEVSRLNLEDVPPQLAANQRIPNHVNKSGHSEPVDTWFQAHVKLDESHPALVNGATGHAKVSVAPQPLGSRLLRWFFHSFRRV
ncbi:MAG: HlyD family efflux transporter periplasmic adaptor subunit, partial [Planctomycetota bacterium]